MAQCPPCLLATSSYDGEIIVWNVVSGHMYCKLNAPSPMDGQDHGEGRDGAGTIACVHRPPHQLELGKLKESPFGGHFLLGRDWP